MKLGVVIPTLNCARLMEAHVDSMLPWLDGADEIIVVDSNSTDGTLEILKTRISHANLRIYQRPRGLYQAWNYGIEQIQSKYTYISTVGDSITAFGIDHLLKVAETYDADVVVSSPELINEDGAKILKKRSFAIENHLKKIQATGPRLLKSIECLDFIVSCFPNAILGSSASNLYRTEVLKKQPFPTSYGTAGDGAWGMAHGLNHRIAVTPGRFSTFLVHKKAYSKSEYVVDNLPDQLLNLFDEGCRAWISSNGGLVSRRDTMIIERVLDQLRKSFLVQKELEKFRRQAWPWILNPVAWNARARRSKIRKRIKMLAESLLTESVAPKHTDDY
jgi:glycosyltransferase involved in cell wall biosynthesis